MTLKEMCEEKRQDCRTGQVFADTSESNSDPLFSLVVLCYKNESLLYGMLNTIFKQTYSRIQLIISDDGTKGFDIDRVQAYVNERKGANIEETIILKNEINMGTVKHIYSVLPRATGEYVVFTAADDRFNTDTVISDYVVAFRKNPGKKWLVGRCCITTPDYKKTIYVTPTNEDATFFEDGNANCLFSRWSRRGMAIPCCMAFKRDAFELVGGIDLEYRYLEDWPLVLKLLRNGYAPIYLDKTIACHSAGGVTNSNERYGVEVRKAFYDDKYLIQKKEVDPYRDLIQPEDIKSLKLYRKEIMDRNYFLDIYYLPASTLEKIKYALKRPRNLFWATEVEYMKRKAKFQRKKMVACSQILFLLSFFFFQFAGNLTLEIMFKCFGALDILAGLILLVCGIVSYPMERNYNRKIKLRRDLVN